MRKFFGAYFWASQKITITNAGRQGIRDKGCGQSEMRENRKSQGILMHFSWHCVLVVVAVSLTLWRTRGAIKVFLFPQQQKLFTLICANNCLRHSFQNSWQRKGCSERVRERGEEWERQLINLKSLGNRLRAANIFSYSC